MGYIDPFEPGVELEVTFGTPVTGERRLIDVWLADNLIDGFDFPVFDIENRTERIICPQCELHQDAIVILTNVFDSYIHDCMGCGYTVMESEWVREGENEKTKTELD